MPATTVWSPETGLVFFRSTEPWGGLTTTGYPYPIRLGALEIASCEHLFQACRFPDDPALQYSILTERRSGLAKQLARQHRDRTRGDWEQVRVAIMDWCLQKKLQDNPTFEHRLASTGTRPLIQRTSRNLFWGAVLQPDGTLVGHNALGRLLSRLRASIRRAVECRESIVVHPPAVPNFRLLDRPILGGTRWQPTVSAWQEPSNHSQRAEASQ